MAGQVESIWRFPVKGLSGESLTSAVLTPGETLRNDRAWAIEQGAPQFDPDAPRYFPKTKFLMLMRDEKLASLETRFDDDTTTLSVSRGGKRVATANLGTPVGRGMAEQFFAAFMGSALPGKPRVVHSEGHHFTDVPAKWVSLINLASVRDIARVAGMEVDPIRFRGNFLIDGLDPWVEKSWLGREVTIGNARLTVEKDIVRCPATNVNPATAQRDMTIPALLASAFGVNLCGIYLSVTIGADVQPGDTVEAH